MTRWTVAASCARAPRGWPPSLSDPPSGNSAYAAPAAPGPGPYGALLAPDANGSALPAGFSSRVLAVSGQPVAGTSYLWNGAPDGGAVFPAPDGGWVYVSNAEIPAVSPLPPIPLPVPSSGGVSAVRFDAGGQVVDAYRILSGTDANCAGGKTPWGTWLSCEEPPVTDDGHVWECNPFEPGQGSSGRPWAPSPTRPPPSIPCAGCCT